MAQPQLKTISLDELHVSKLNMRHSRKKPDITDILPSIRKDGLRQTLLVRKEGESYGVIAGRRRYYALLAIAKETGKTPRVPCAIMEAGDDAAAIEASLIENVAACLRARWSNIPPLHGFQSKAGRSARLRVISV